jgi:transcriptional regulator with XRE-family HTH domain
MALFFDSQWFDARLAAAGLTRGALAAALGIGEAQVAEIWKDQRELSADDVRVLGLLLGAPPAEIADRAGVSTPVPKEVEVTSLGDLAERLTRVERALADIRSLILALHAKAP